MNSQQIKNILENSNKLSEISVEGLQSSCNDYIQVEKIKKSSFLSDTAIQSLVSSTLLMATSIDLDILFNGTPDDLKKRVENKLSINAQDDIDQSYVGELANVIARIFAPYKGVVPFARADDAEAQTEESIKAQIDDALPLLNIGHLTYAIGMNEKTYKPVVYVCQINSPSTPEERLFYRHAQATVSALATAVNSTSLSGVVEVQSIEFSGPIAKLLMMATYEPERDNMLTYVSGMSQINEAEILSSISLVKAHAYRPNELQMIEDWVLAYRNGRNHIDMMPELRHINAEYFNTVEKFAEDLLPSLKRIRQELPKDPEKFRMLVEYTQSYILELLYDRDLLVGEIIDMKNGIGEPIQYQELPMSSLVEELMTLKKAAGEMFSPAFYERVEESQPFVDPATAYVSGVLH